ncbi:MAG TPA: hypothetical protein VGP55_13025 [Chitinophagaceae bacterium]|nr:hypothetical protein [Chitinophagaceae bacterium]
MNVGTNYSESFYHNIAHDANALEKNVDEYPFSSLTQYVLLCWYSKTGHAGFEKLLKKTSLYFNNNHWLQFQLSQIKTETSENAFVEDTGFKTGLHNQSQDHFAVVTDEQLIFNQNSESLPGDEEKFIPGTHSLGSPIENYYEKESQYNNENGYENVIQNRQEFIHDSQTLGTYLHNIPETEKQPDHENVRPEIVNEDEMPVPHTQTLGTHLENNPAKLQQNYENDHDEVFHKEEMPVPDTQSLGIHLENTPETKNFHLFDKESAKVISEYQLTEIGNFDTQEPIAFEPLHTVDYFASQGIRITEEALTNDKLGTQMKSFTEWLKSMKKLNPLKMQEQNALAEDVIQSAAEISNIDTEVLTEAMAEVLIKQNKKDKAIEMYNKLSLINPSKSAYFATKIENIKST